MSIRSRLERLERLEQWQSAGVSIWDVFFGERDVADLDDNGKAILQQVLNDAQPVRDTIEERIAAALANPAGSLSSTGSPGPPPSNQGDD
jgi:hypothetical protein